MIVTDNFVDLDSDTEMVVVCVATVDELGCCWDTTTRLDKKTNKVTRTASYTLESIQDGADNGHSSPVSGDSVPPAVLDALNSEMDSVEKSVFARWIACAAHPLIPASLARIFTHIKDTKAESFVEYLVAKYPGEEGKIRAEFRHGQWEKLNKRAWTSPTTVEDHVYADVIMAERSLTEPTACSEALPVFIQAETADDTTEYYGPFKYATIVCGDLFVQPPTGDEFLFASFRDSSGTFVGRTGKKYVSITF